MEDQIKARGWLSFLIGKWKTNGETEADNKTPAVKFEGTDSYEWTLDGQFILHTVDVTMGGDRVQAMEFIGEFDEQTKKYTMRSFDSHGAYLEMKAHLDGTGDLHIEGNNMRSILSVTDENNLTARWERSEDNKKWMSWMKLTLSKQVAKNNLFK
jgi:hypothetical protein